MLFTSPQYPKQKVTLRSARHTFDSAQNKIFVQGLQIKFVDGLYETNDPEEIKLIKELNVYGTEIFSADPGVITEPSAEAIKRANIEKAAVPDPTGCPKCVFKAKNKLGLMSHIRAKHGNDTSSDVSSGAEVTNVDDLLPPPGE